MKRKALLSTLCIVCIVLFLFPGCEQETETARDNNLEGQTGIHLEGAWARPGSEGRISAAYFLITNFGDEPDILLSAESDVARNVEVHESYESEEGMIGMREVLDLEIPAQSTVRFEQGGLHIMLIQLTRQLQDGDSFNLTLTFENHGTLMTEIPVRLL
ncbi:hypothetical protein BH23BAC3_BH23BAC3_28520 [soil metagenome]